MKDINEANAILLGMIFNSQNNQTFFFLLLLELFPSSDVVDPQKRARFDSGADMTEGGGGMFIQPKSCSNNPRRLC